MKQINLLVLTRTYPVEVAGTKRVQHLLEYLNKHEILIKVLSIRSTRYFEKEIGIYKGIKYERIGSYVSLDLLQLHKIVFYFFQTIKSIYNAKKKESKNILYSYGALNVENLFFVLFAKFMGYKVIFDIVEDYTAFTDSLNLFSQFKRWTVTKLDRLNVYLSDAIVVISTKLQHKYEQLKAKKLTLIPITAKTTVNFRQKKELNQSFMIVYAGSFGDKDGVNLIIEGFLEFYQSNSNSQLYLIGTGEQQMSYKDRYKGFSNIFFTDFIPDDEYFAMIFKADVLCMCRTNTDYANSGFPFKLGEYLATGNPVIATKVSDVELFLNDDNAYLIDPDNKQQFVDAIISIKSDPLNALKKGMNGFNICKSSFSPKINGQILLDLLIKI